MEYKCGSQKLCVDIGTLLHILFLYQTTDGPNAFDNGSQENPRQDSRHFKLGITNWWRSVVTVHLVIIGLLLKITLLGQIRVMTSASLCSSEAIN